MFNIFKKRTSFGGLNNVEENFITTIINILSPVYPLFKEELELNTFVGIGKNPGGSEGSFTYFISTESWKKISNPSTNNYDIKDIKFKSYSGKSVSVDLYISEGLIIGYKASAPTKEIDPNTIDVSDTWEKHFLNEDYSDIAAVVSKLSNEQIKKLNMVKNTFKIVINHKSYYPIHDLYDGSYIATDKDGAVFEITHDPFKASEIFHSIDEFIEKGLS